MENTKISIKDIIDEFEITKNRAEFTNDLNLFFNMMAFDNSKGKYYNIIKNRFNDYMKDWDIDLNKNFMFICKYIKSNKLPYKIAKDEGFENIKSDKFIISILVELYAIKIIISNKEIIKKYDIANFIYKEFMNNGIEVRRNDIVLNDLEYIFKDDNIYSICKSRLEYRKEDVNKSIVQVIKVLEGRKNIKVNLRYMITYKNNNGRNLIKELDEIKCKIKLKDKLINEYIENEKELKYEIEKLQSQNNQLLNIGNEQYKKALIDLVKTLNDSSNGNLLDRLYCYLKDEDAKNLPFIVSNLLNVLRQMGIYPRETIKIGKIVPIEEYSFYNYRINKDISDIKLCEGEIVYPAWFYNDKEIIKPYVNIKGE